MSALILTLISSKHHMWRTFTQTGILLTFLSLQMIYSPALGNSYLSPSLTTHSLSTPLISLTLLFLPLMMMASNLVQINRIHPRIFMATTLILILILMVTFSTSSMLWFYIFFELSLIPTSVLIIMWGYQPERISAMMYLLLYMISFSLPLLFSITYLYSSQNTVNFSMAFCSNTASSHLYPHLLTISFVMALLVKLPMFFTHLWLPKAHVEAPVAGSMILAGILLKLGAYGLLQFIPFTMMSYTVFPSSLSPLAIIGALLASIICLQQTDMKSMIAYASVSHMGLLLAAVMLGTSSSYNGALFMSVAHGLASSALFALANYTYNMTGTRNLMLIKGLTALAPPLAFWWFLFLCLNLAAPPSLNFISELLLIISILTPSLNLTPLILLIIILSAAYSLILYTSINHGSPSLFLLSTLPFPAVTQLTLLLHFSPLLMLVLSPQLMMWNS